MTVTQSEFTAAILDPQQPAPAGVRDAAGAPTAKRFDVYRNNVAVSLTDALIAAFPVIYKLVGDDFFKAMAGVYLRTHLPNSALMMYYGDKMPQFLKRFPPAQSLPYLPDVAKLEIALREAYHAADATAVSAETLGALAPEALMAATVKLSPAVRVVRSAYPVLGIWRANMVPGAEKPGNKAECVLVTRSRFDPAPHLLTPQEADFIDALQDGHALGVAMSKVGTGLDLGHVLGLLLREAALTDITTRP